MIVKECLMELKKINPSQKVFFASGHDMQSEKQHLVDLGAIGVLQKP